ncbi:hypothetical protein Vadar_024195 [Vaccinium darrowii]|uniref:Uncharacterized protein n=1 Tax=Vaccinium darrowii TaxID=229202 RepID=A0ACB7Z7D2_9ERIC|nr:hypothetical protein Vadar_024195 [Vaccinium darrowii]
METIVNIISEVASTIVFLHIGYLFQYKGNFHNLEVETERLEHLLRRIDYKVETAKNNAEIIDSDVEKWQKDAKGLKDEIAAFLENKVRLNSWCPMWCYWLGKESKLKTSQVISLKEQGTKFSESPVSHHDDNDSCCKVLVTSQKQLLHMMTSKPVDQRALGVSIEALVALTKDFRIPLLVKKEAQTLFMKTAEIPVNSHEDIPSVAKEVCDECGRLPVAILVVATALKRKESFAWRDALTLLRNSNFDQIVDIDPNLFSSLKLSYDSLEPRDARSRFLLCSLFPEDAEISIEDLVIYSFGMRLLDRITTLEDVRNRVLTLVKGLKASCLLLEGRDDNTVKMHDVIRDVAIWIAKGEKRYLVEHDLKKWPEGATFEGNLAISLKSEYFCEIPSELGSQKLHTLVLRSKDSSLPDSFFKGMDTNLEVLDLSGMAIDSVPFSLSKLVKLRMLHLPDQVRDISLLGEIKSLEILRVNGIQKLAPEIRQLNCLKLLDLGNNNNLGVIAPNVLSNLTRLEELCIPDCFNQWQDEATDRERRNASLVELNSLTCLTTLKVHIPEGKSSPNNLCFENLVRFRISIGKCFLRYELNMSSTNFLKLSGVPLEDKFKVLLVKSEVLYLHDVKGLDDGEHLLGRQEQFLQTPQLASSRSFCKLSNLMVQSCGFNYLFHLSTARRLQQLQVLEVAVPAIIYPNINEIKIVCCPNLESIFSTSTVRNLAHLQYLTLGNKCSVFQWKAIVETSKEREGANNEPFVFPELNMMLLMGMVNLQGFCSSYGPEESLFNQKVVFPSMECMEISRLGNMEGIWNRTPPANSFQKLKSLQLNECHDLLYVGPSELLIGCLQNLEDLIVMNCKLLEEVFKSRESNSGEGIVSEDEQTSAAIDTNVVLPRLREVIQYCALPQPCLFWLSRSSSSKKVPSSNVLNGVVKKRKADATSKMVKSSNKKNSGAPKRPSSAFFVFMDDFRKSYKENFPDNKSVSVVGKAGGEKWKAMSESEKAPYVAKAVKKKAEYEKAKEEFDRKLLSGNGAEKPEESEKSSAEVHDDPEQEASS